MILINNNVPIAILSDMKRFKQVLFNLIGNALKFTFKGRVVVTAEFHNELLQVDVTDSGVGIKEEDLGKLFKFFGCLQRTKDVNKGGMGLGLTISKMIIQQLGGTISASSIFGEGSKFQFSIPINEF